VSPGQGPISGSLSGVAARNPVHTRIVDICDKSGMYASARLSMRTRIGLSTRLSSTSYCDDYSMRICRFAWLHIKRYRIAGGRVRTLQVAQFNQLVPDKPGIAVGNDQMPLTLLDGQTWRQQRRAIAGSVNDGARR
jgi:hypothetical protein